VRTLIVRSGALGSTVRLLLATQQRPLLPQFDMHCNRLTECIGSKLVARAAPITAGMQECTAVGGDLEGVLLQHTTRARSHRGTHISLSSPWISTIRLALESCNKVNITADMQHFSGKEVAPVFCVVVRACARVCARVLEHHALQISPYSITISAVVWIPLVTSFTMHVECLKSMQN
jgi:hypothetical protein